MSLDAFAILAAVHDTSGQVVDFRLQYVNPAAVKIAGTTRAQIEGKLMSEVFPGTMTNSDMFERYINVIDTGQPHDLEIPYDAEGIHGWFRNMAVKLGDGVAVSFFDITERKRHEAELTYQAFLLANMSDAVFVVDLDRRITHWNHGAEVLYGWQAAEVIGRLAPDVLDDLLTYSRAGRTLQPPEQVDTGVLVQETVDLLNLPLGFQVLLPPAMPVLVTERVPLATVFRNLIQNAYKHHDHPDRGCVIRLTSSPGHGATFTFTWPKVS